MCETLFYSIIVIVMLRQHPSYTFIDIIYMYIVFPYDFFFIIFDHSPNIKRAYVFQFPALHFSTKPQFMFYSLIYNRAFYLK